MSNFDLNAALLVKSKIEGVLDKWDRANPHLECDGFVRIASFLLRKAEFRHRVMFGEVLVDLPFGEKKGQKPCVVRPHFWIEVPPIPEFKVGAATGPTLIVDYRLRMWVSGDHSRVPHGVFTKYEHIVYTGTECELACSQCLFDILTAKPPTGAQTIAPEGDADAQARRTGEPEKLPQQGEG